LLPAAAVPASRATSLGSCSCCCCCCIAARLQCCSDSHCSSGSFVCCCGCLKRTIDVYMCDLQLTVRRAAKVRSAAAITAAAATVKYCCHCCCRVACYEGDVVSQS
jgi:hypothetical protein